MYLLLVTRVIRAIRVSSHQNPSLKCITVKLRKCTISNQLMPLSKLKTAANCINKLKDWRKRDRRSLRRMEKDQDLVPWKVPTLLKDKDGTPLQPNLDLLQLCLRNLSNLSRRQDPSQDHLPD